MPWLRTAAFSLMPARRRAIGAGATWAASAAWFAKWSSVGGGNYSSRDLVAVQDNFGIDRSSGVTDGDGLIRRGDAGRIAGGSDQALRRCSSVDPILPQDQLDDARMMSMQELRAMEDEPTHRVMRRLRELHYGEKLGRSIYGTEPGIEAITQDDVREFYTDALPRRRWRFWRLPATSTSLPW